MKKKLILFLIITTILLPYKIGFADQAKLDTPTDLAAFAMYNQINLSWVDNSNGEEGYSIERKQGLDDFNEIAKVSPNTEFYLDINLKTYTTYYYRVRAFAGSEFSNYSNEAFATTEGTPQSGNESLTAPSDLRAIVVSEREVELRWRDNSDSEDGFKLERKALNSEYKEIAEVGADINYYLDKTVTPKMFYYYRVKAYNKSGESAYSNEVLVETKVGETPPPEEEKVPLAPSDLEGTLEENTIYFKWKDNSDNEEGFRLYISINEIDSYALYAQLSANETAYEDSSLYIPGNTYYFKLTAFNKVGESNPTNEIMIKIKGLSETDSPLPPTDLKVEEIYEKDVVLSWKDNSDNEEGFKLERRKIGEGKFEIVQTLPPNMTAFRDEGLESGMTYYYRIFAFNAAGSSLPSNTVEVKTKGGGEPPTPQKIVIILKIGSKVISVNGKDSLMDVTPTIIEGRTLLPIRYVVEALGGKVDFEANTKKITITLRDTKIEMWINNPVAYVNGKKAQIDPDNPNVKPLVVPPGRTLVPLRFVAENLGCKVDWEPSEKKITITLAF
jgi:titin